MHVVALNVRRTQKKKHLYKIGLEVLTYIFVNEEEDKR